MSLLDELKQRFHIVEGDSISEHQKSASSKQPDVIVNKNVSAVGGAGYPTSAFPAKCKVCHQIMTLTPAIPEAVCGCGIVWSLPIG